MGYQVNPGKTAYNGVPTASIIKLNTNRSAWNKPKGVSTVPLTFPEIIRMLSRGCGYFGVVMFYLSILLFCFYAFYILNVYMIKWEDENEALAERQRRIDAVKKRRVIRKAEKEKLEKELKSEVQKVKDEQNEEQKVETETNSQS